MQWVSWPTEPRLRRRSDMPCTSRRGGLGKRQAPVHAVNNSAVVQPPLPPCANATFGHKHLKRQGSRREVQRDRGVALSGLDRGWTLSGLGKLNAFSSVLLLWQNESLHYGLELFSGESKIALLQCCGRSTGRKTTRSLLRLLCDQAVCLHLEASLKLMYSVLERCCILLYRDMLCRYKRYSLLCRNARKSL